MAEALYRKYRPQVFEDVVGQEPIERTLKNAIDQDKVSHAYLFTGPRGTGKTTTARLLAKALLCEKGPTSNPDGTCDDCELIAEGAHPDVYELDAASRTGVENVREEIISRVQFAPTRGRFKVYIIDEVHMLSTAAFNALLKTLEEPPSHVVFVLCTTDPQKVPETIHSRCQRFDFRRIAPESMVSRLGAICMAEDVEFEGEALDLIAHRAEGGLRNALTSLEQIIAFENGKVTLAGAERLLGAIDSNDMAEIMAYIGKRDIANCFRWTANYVETGADLAQFVRDMAEHVRNLYVLALVGDDVDLDVSETARRELASELQWYGPDRLSRFLGVLGDLSAELKTSSNPRLSFEIALTRMVRPDSDLTLESLAERIEALESGYSSVAHVLPGEPYALHSDGQATSGDDAFVQATPVQAVPSAEPSRQFQQPQAQPYMQQPQQSYEQPQWQQSQFPQQQQQSRPAQAQGQPVDSYRQEAYQPQQQPVQAQEAARFQGQSQQGGVREGGQGGAQVQAQSHVQAQAQQQPQAQPQVQPQAQASSPLAALQNPAALQRVWQAALSAVKKQKQAYGVLFMNTKARYDEAAGMMKIVFPAESTFAFNAVQKQDVQDALANALAKAVGAPVPFCYEQGGASTQGFGAPVQSAAQTAQPEPSNFTRAEPARRVQTGPEYVQQAAQPAYDQQVSSTMRPTSSEEPMPRPVPEPTPEPVPEPTPRLVPEPTPEPTPTSVPEPAPQSAPQPAPYDAVPYEEVPYEQVPYDEMPYDEAPYEPAPYEEFDAKTAPSPGEPNTTPEGAPLEDAGALQAMLQAGFGGGVVFSEVDE